MGNNLLFKALSSETRLSILKLLAKKEMHLSELARRLKISTPVVSRHVKILEKANLIKTQTIGNIHLLSANIKGLEEQIMDTFVERSTVKINENASLFDALKQLPNVEIKKIGENRYITSIDGEKGYYIYEVDGVPPQVPIDEYKPEKNIMLNLKKLVPVNKKKIKIKISSKTKKV